jgi:hypothetical protein
VEQTQAASLRLADRAERRITGLWQLHLRGQLTRAEFRAIAAASVAEANTAGVGLADIGVAAEATRALRQPVGPLGLSPTAVQVDQSRIAGDIDRIVDDRPVTVPADQLSESRNERLRRLARSEPLLTVAASVQTAMSGQGADGWTRRLDNDPCPACVGWADGVVRPVGTRMARHLGCACIQQPTWSAT